MNFRTGLFAIFAASCIGVLLPRAAAADESDKRTTLTFSHSVAVPGKVLPAGTYVFQLADSLVSRHLVQVFDQEGRLLTTVFTIPTARFTAAGDTRITFDEQRAGGPFPIKEWFYPGDVAGEEFIYRRTRTVGPSARHNAALE